MNSSFNKIGSQSRTYAPSSEDGSDMHQLSAFWVVLFFICSLPALKKTSIEIYFKGSSFK